jgi:hypothetical protein
MALDPTAIRRRLAFIRYIYRRGQEQSNMADPLCSVALLSQHDAIDMFLYLGVEHLDLTVSTNNSLKEVWGTLDKKLEELSKPRLTQKTPVERLNKARVELKHRGTRPSKSDILEFQMTTHAALSENSSTLFDVDFATVSLVDLISSATVRDLLDRAVQHVGQGDYNEAMKGITLAFHELLASHRLGRHQSDPSTGRRAPRLRPQYNTTGSGASREFKCINSLTDQTERAFTGMHTELQRLESAIQLIGLGIDYRKYVLFINRAPLVIRDFGGGVVARDAFDGDVPEARMREVTDYCLNFVIDTALTLESFDDSISRKREQGHVSDDFDDLDEYDA